MTKVFDARSYITSSLHKITQFSELYHNKYADNFNPALKKVNQRVLDSGLHPVVIGESFKTCQLLQILTRCDHFSVAVLKYSERESELRHPARGTQ